MNRVDAIQFVRELLERQAAAIAADIAPGDYYADGNSVKSHIGGIVVAQCHNHSQAVRVLLAIPKARS